MRKLMTMIAVVGALCSCAGVSHATQDELSGTWRGVVRKGAMENVVFFRFSRAGAGYQGNYWGTAPLGAPLPLTGIELGHSVRFEVPSRGVFEGEVVHGIIEGTFEDAQGGGSFHLEKQAALDDGTLAV
jgi:hypothetical protein